MMERALKERIIGAVVLVIIVVLVVPVFLDGPPESGGIVSERVLLPGQEGQDTKTVVLDRQRTEPMPAVSTSTDAPETSSPAAAEPKEETTQPQPQPIVQKPAVRTVEQSPPKLAAETPTVTATTTGMWAVQLGSFSNNENAEKQAASLRKQGYAAFLSQVNTSSGQMHRVRIGPQKDRESAEAMAARLLKVGHKGQVLPHP
jgi:DedD protein